MSLGVGEIQPTRGLVGHDAFLDLGDNQPFAGRATLVDAIIAVGVELPLVAEHADFVIAKKDDAAVAILEFRSFAHELFRHPSSHPWFLCLPAATAGCLAITARGAEIKALYRTVCANATEERKAIYARSRVVPHRPCRLGRQDVNKW